MFNDKLMQEFNNFRSNISTEDKNPQILGEFSKFKSQIKKETLNSSLVKQFREFHNEKITDQKVDTSPLKKDLDAFLKVKTYAEPPLCKDKRFAIFDFLLFGKM